MVAHCLCRRATIYTVESFEREGVVQGMGVFDTVRLYKSSPIVGPVVGEIIKNIVFNDLEEI